MLNIFKKRAEKKKALQQAKEQRKAERHKDDAQKIADRKAIANAYFDLIGKGKSTK